MAIWDEVPREIWRVILEKLSLTDHIPFSGVCRLWRSIGLEYRNIKIPTHVPGLIIPGSNSTSSVTRRFLAHPVGKNINNQGDEHDNLPVLSIPHESLCCGSHQGWLVMIEKNMTMYLQNPLSGSRFDLPPVTSLPKPRPGDTLMSKWYVEKAILSASPSSSSTSDCFVLVFYGRGELAYCKVGDKAWKLLDGPKPWGYIDAIFYKEHFYIVDNYGRVYVSESLSTVSQPRVNEIDPPPPHWISFVQKWYLVELGGELVHILKKVELSGDTTASDEEEEDDEDGIGNENNDGNELALHEGESSEDEDDGGNNDNDNEEDGIDNQNNDDEEEEEQDANNNENDEDEFDDFDYDNNYSTSVRNFMSRTTEFLVFKLDTIGLEPKWVGVKDFDGGAVFLGYNQSFALSKSNLMGYKGDRIYYTDDDLGGQKLHVCSGFDVGVFNVKDSNFEALYSTDSESTKPHAVWITPMPW